MLLQTTHQVYSKVFSNSINTLLSRNSSIKKFLTTPKKVIKKYSTTKPLYKESNNNSKENNRINNTSNK